MCMKAIKHKKQRSKKAKKNKNPKAKLQMKTNLPARNLWCGWGGVGSRGVVKCGGRRKYDRERPDGASVRESRAEGTEGWAWAKLRNGQTGLSQSAQHPWTVHVKPQRGCQGEPTGLFYIIDNSEWNALRITHVCMCTPACMCICVQ